MRVVFPVPLQAKWLGLSDPVDKAVVHGWSSIIQHGWAGWVEPEKNESHRHLMERLDGKSWLLSQSERLVTVSIVLKPPRNEERHKTSWSMAEYQKTRQFSALMTHNPKQAGRVTERDWEVPVWCVKLLVEELVSLRRILLAIVWWVTTTHSIG